MNSELLTLGIALLIAVAEWLQARRVRRMQLLAFGPSGQPRRWTGWAAPLRCAAVVALSWGLINLALLPSRSLRVAQIPEGGYRHLVLLLDVSPSMQLKDAGPTRQQTRMQRASEVLLSFFQRIALDQVRISVVAFYNGAKPVVVDTFDLEVVKNILNDLPLDYAFEFGKTKILDGLREAAILAKPWQPESTTLLLVSDGDTVPDSGMPEMPASVAQTFVVGVGDPGVGKFIDGHQSRQDASTLRQLAARLGGHYHNANEKHVPTDQLALLAKSLPLADVKDRGRRELSLLAIAFGAVSLAGLPCALALFGSRWRPERRRAASAEGLVIAPR